MKSVKRLVQAFLGKLARPLVQWSVAAINDGAQTLLIHSSTPPWAYSSLNHGLSPPSTRIDDHQTGFMIYSSQ